MSFLLWKSKAKRYLAMSSSQRNEPHDLSNLSWPKRHLGFPQELPPPLTLLTLGAPRSNQAEVERIIKASSSVSS